MPAPEVGAKGQPVLESYEKASGDFKY